MRRSASVLVAVLVIVVVGCLKSVDPGKGQASEVRTVEPAAGTGGEFEMHIRFDAQGRELSRECLERVPFEAGKYKGAELKPIECPSKVAVTVGAPSDPLGLRGH